MLGDVNKNQCENEGSVKVFLLITKTDCYLNILVLLL